MYLMSYSYYPIQTILFTVSKSKNLVFAFPLLATPSYQQEKDLNSRFCIDMLGSTTHLFDAGNS